MSTKTALSQSEIDTLLANIDQQLLGKLLDSLVLEQSPLLDLTNDQKKRES